MKTFKIVVYSVLFVFHLSAIIILSVGRNDLNFLLDLFGKMDWLLYGAYIGLFFFFITVAFHFLHQRNILSLEKKHAKEINELKARLYDKKESDSAVTTPAASVVKEDASEESTDTDKKVD